MAALAAVRIPTAAFIVGGFNRIILIIIVPTAAHGITPRNGLLNLTGRDD
jgi:hypothetical protein